MIKSYTDLFQSKKLAEILPIESADMEYMFLKEDGTKVINIPFVKDDEESEWPNDSAYDFIPCWSFAALLGVIREIIGYTLYGVNNFGVDNVYMSCILGDKPWKLETEVYDNEVDACYEMIIKLNELNLL